EKITGIIEKFGSSPQISTCLIGWLDGKLIDGEEHRLLERAFMVIDARIINKINTEQFVSYTGFTSEITNWLQVADEKINLNIAMRYSPYDNRTYITIGSPIITQEY
ncbi:MAG: YwmB family TATA-box binding protein, partial [Sporomusaceae bacterium]|nr:YwmB family TATA-box binding protein [Sporomusaceae bacterium]